MLKCFYCSRIWFKLNCLTSLSVSSSSLCSDEDNMETDWTNEQKKKNNSTSSLSVYLVASARNKAIKCYRVRCFVSFLSFPLSTKERISLYVCFFLLLLLLLYLVLFDSFLFVEFHSRHCIENTTKGLRGDLNKTQKYIPLLPWTRYWLFNQ